jgi:hypothetical protein
LQQFEVIKATTLCLGRMIETHVSEAIGRKINVIYEYSPEARRGAGSVSIHFIELKPGANTEQREYEHNGGQEQFRAPPMVFQARFLVSAWAKPPEDQALLGAIMRTFLDHPMLAFSGDEEQVVAYASEPSVNSRLLGLEEHSILANANQMPMAPSISYEVDLRLRSQKVTAIKRVRERVIDFRNIEG